MTTIDTPARPSALGDGTVGTFVARAADWATSTDHKKIGRLYAVTGLLAAVAVAVIGALLGLERTDDAGNVLDGGALLQLFQLHRIGLVFAMAIPVTLGVAIAIAPMQVGARAMAFPRLALTGFYSWLGGITLTIVALAANGGIGGGDQMVDMFLAGLGLTVLGLLASAASVATTVLTTRAPGVTLRRVPFMTWSALVQSLALLVALPVMFGAIVLLFVDTRNAGLTFGGPEAIGDWISMFWSQPMTYIYALPALGLLAETLPVAFGRRHPLRQVVFAGLGLIAVGAFAGVAQQQRFGVDFSAEGADVVKQAVIALFFYGLPLLGAVVVLALGAIVAKPEGDRVTPKISAGLLFGVVSTLMILAGAAGSLLAAIDDLELAGTVFEEAAAVYVTYGALLGGLGALVFWAPKLWGIQVADRKVLPLAGLGLIATVAASLPHYIAGFTDQPAGAGIYDGDGASTILNGIVLVGHALMALTVLATLGAIASSRSDDTVEANPVGGHTLEWTIASPAPADNFEALPTVSSAEPELDNLAGTEGSPS
ncbi:MAG: hypothetical protein EBS20_00775 [Actinobacteria bacterium]|nr:hypothetical protein [Actinomycetota bacterium]